MNEAISTRPQLTASQYDDWAIAASAVSGSQTLLLGIQLLSDASHRSLELDTVRARSIVSPRGHQTAYKANPASETRWGLGLDKEHFPQANIIRYSLIQYTGGTFAAGKQEPRWMQTDRIKVHNTVSRSSASKCLSLHLTCESPGSIARTLLRCTCASHWSRSAN